MVFVQPNGSTNLMRVCPVQCVVCGPLCDQPTGIGSGMGVEPREMGYLRRRGMKPITFLTRSGRVAGWRPPVNTPSVPFHFLKLIASKYSPENCPVPTRPLHNEIHVNLGSSLDRDREISHIDHYDCLPCLSAVFLP